MAEAMIPLQIASSAMTVLGQLKAGKAAQATANAEARQREQAAKQDRAVAQRKAIEVRRQTARVQSDALARSAATGGGADQTTRTTLARLEGDGELSALNAMAEGEDRARNREFGAAMDRFQGKVARQKANLGALSEGLSFATKLSKGFNDGTSKW